MLRIAACAAVVALSASGAVAQAPPANEAAAMHDFFGAALQIDLPGGEWSAKRYYAPDHTYREHGSGGEVHGVWSIENGKICAAQADPPEGSPARYCNVGVGKKLGETWRDTDPVTGNTVTFTLKPA
ncbi:MAG TPA: hypothetical protein VHN39_06230 [Phenylobacterium sp.]|jgi:hypothetical protein|nr:hypothetical protein [Phenylobacterium sp.]